MGRREFRVFGESLLPASPSRVAKTEPMKTSFPSPPAVSANVPVAVAANEAVVVQVILNVLFVAAIAVYERLWVAREFGSLRGRERRWCCKTGAKRP